MAPARGRKAARTGSETLFRVQATLITVEPSFQGHPQGGGSRLPDQHQMDENKKAGHDDRGIMLDHAALQLPPCASCQVVRITDDVEAAIDDVLFGPGGQPAIPFSVIRPTPITIRSTTVRSNQSQISPSLFDRLHDRRIVEFIHVILVQQGSYSRAGFARPADRRIPGRTLYR